MFDLSLGKSIYSKKKVNLIRFGGKSWIKEESFL